MPRHEDSRSRGRGPPVIPRYADEDRFEFRLREGERYGPPARRPHYEEDEFLVYTDDPRRRVESPPPRPRLLRRQSSLDTFDRISSRRRKDSHYYDHPKVVVPSPPRRPSPSPHRHDRDYYEDIRIAEPDYYGDEEYREFREREHPTSRRRRPSSPPRFRGHTFEEVVEKPYPRRGKTRIPRRLVHTGAIIELGYPFKEESDKIIILVALSKDQIDEVISLSREFKRLPEARASYHRAPQSPRRPVHSARSSRETLIVEPSPHRRRSGSQLLGVSTIARPRSVSVHNRSRRHSSPPPHMVELRDGDVAQSEDLRVGPLTVIARPRDDYDDHDHHYDRHGGVDINTRTETIEDDGEYEKIVETRRDRKGRLSMIWEFFNHVKIGTLTMLKLVPHPRLVRAMLATLT
ncbi:hypothetical protein MAP00_001626 [Monascus purpureus]|nr:hypothetical protein MAP00_001626 [Monascus purpureus]